MSTLITHRPRIVSNLIHKDRKKCKWVRVMWQILMPRLPYNLCCRYFARVREEREEEKNMCKALQCSTYTYTSSSYSFSYTPLKCYFLNSLWMILTYLSMLKFHMLMMMTTIMRHVWYWVIKLHFIFLTQATSSLASIFIVMGHNTTDPVEAATKWVGTCKSFF